VDVCSAGRVLFEGSNLRAVRRTEVHPTASLALDLAFADSVVAV